MNNIEVGEWGRTNLGNIIKFAWLECEEGKRDEEKVILIDLMKTHTRPFYYFKKDEHIVNHSKNIIDLIEVGDYVNGSRVEYVMEDMKTGDLNLEMTYNYTNEEKGDCTIYNKDIKSIVTKQQFQAIEYKIGG